MSRPLTNQSIKPWFGMFADFYGVHRYNHDQFRATKKTSLNMALKKYVHSII